MHKECREFCRLDVLRNVHYFLEEGSIRALSMFTIHELTILPFCCSEYGVYLTRKSECALLRREAATYPIPSLGDLTVGEIKLPHTHTILLDQP